MNVNMGGTEEAQGTILCSVASDILTFNFEMPASEMRDLQKTEPDRCQKIVQERGLKIKASLVVLASTRFKLVQSAAGYFGGEASRDGSKPFLQLLHRD